jgi:transcription termination factor NusB
MRRINSATFQWRLSNFSNACPTRARDNAIVSDVFTVRRWHWRIELFTDRFSSLGVFLALHSALEAGQSVEVDYSLRVINQRDISVKRERSSRNIFDAEHVDYGFCQFISLSDLEQQGFVVGGQDLLVVEVEMNVLTSVNPAVDLDSLASKLGVAERVEPLELDGWILVEKVDDLFERFLSALVAIVDDVDERVADLRQLRLRWSQAMDSADAEMNGDDAPRDFNRLRATWRTLVDCARRHHALGSDGHDVAIANQCDKGAQSSSSSSQAIDTGPRRSRRKSRSVYGSHSLQNKQNAMAEQKAKETQAKEEPPAQATVNDVAALFEQLAAAVEEQCASLETVVGVVKDDRDRLDAMVSDPLIERLSARLDVLERSALHVHPLQSFALVEDFGADEQQDSGAPLPVSWSCDLCDDQCDCETNSSRHTERWRCEECDFDVCEQCSADALASFSARRRRRARVLVDDSDAKLWSDEPTAKRQRLACSMNAVALLGNCIDSLDENSSEIDTALEYLTTVRSMASVLREASVGHRLRLIEEEARVIEQCKHCSERASATLAATLPELQRQIDVIVDATKKERVVWQRAHDDCAAESMTRDAAELLDSIDAMDARLAELDALSEQLAREAADLVDDDDDAKSRARMPSPMRDGVERAKARQRSEFNRVANSYQRSVSQVTQDRVSFVDVGQLIAEHLLCPLTGKPMADPVICVGDGYSYERKAIVDYLRKPSNAASPVTHEALTSRRTIPNHSLKKFICSIE